MSPRSRVAAACLTCCLACLAFLSKPVAAEPAAGEQLPTDPALVKGELDNGLRYIVRKHANPPGRATVWIHIHSGARNETDRQQGIAHYLEHMAFNGSANFEPGSLVPFFQSLGMQFGRDQNAFTNFGQTTYQLTLPNVEPATLDKAFTFFADVVHRLSLSPVEIENERGIIQEERRRGLSARQRVSDYIRPRLYPGSVLGTRNVIGQEETIAQLNQDDFKAYYGKWYGASNATVMVVADEEPDKIIALIKDKFGTAAKQPRPTPQDVNVKSYEKSFAIVASDPELRSEEVSITRIEPARPVATTVEQYRADLVRSMGSSALNRRFSDKVAAGGTPYTSGSAQARNQPDTIYEVELSARASRGNWQTAMDAAATELLRARKFGFTEREIEDVKKEMISGAEWAVQTEESATASALISRLNAGVGSGAPIMSPQQRLDLLNRLLPTITGKEISEAFAKEFQFDAFAVVATLPASGSLPSESELLNAAAKSLAIEPEQEAEVARATELMKQLPTPGTVAGGEEHAATKVWSGWLSNNVRVHYRYMDKNKNDATVQISLLGGELFETADNRGVTSAAQLAWGRPATKGLSSTDIRELMVGKKVNVRGGGMFGGGGRRGGGGGGGGGRDAINLTISGSPDEFETGFQLAYLLLTEPKIEPAAFKNYQTTSREMLQETLKNPAAVGARLAGAAPYPDDEPRVKPLDVEEIDKLTVEAAQAWLDKLIATSPIEVTIVGDVPQEKVLTLAAKYLGALPSRPKVETGMFADLRKLKRPAGPRVVEQTIETPTKQAFVFSGFYGADEANRNDVRLLSMATRILSTRMVKEVREDAQLVYSIGASSRPGSTFPGFGIVSAAAPTDPSKAQPLVAKLAEMYDAFAKEGPTEEELAVAKKQFANTLDEQMKEPGYWLGRISNMTYRGVNLDEILADPQAYQSMTPEQVKQAFAKYWAKENSVVVIVKPSTGANQTSALPRETETAAAAGN